jgi:predicted dehydrogenase
MIEIIKFMFVQIMARTVIVLNCKQTRKKEVVLKKIRYAIVGTGSRYRMFAEAIVKTFADRNELVAFCDRNPGRMQVANERLQEDFGHDPVATYGPEDFKTMIKEQQVDIVVVTSVDRTHHHFLIQAMECGCDAITEKPMTTGSVECQAVLDAVQRTGKNVRVTFNYRYSPRNSKVKELLMSGVIGDVKSVHFEWLLDTKHGADYFRRWHRDKKNSGGLMVHKSTHHFDLVNWWLDSQPSVVYADGGLVFYGRENAESRGQTQFYHRGTDNPIAAQDPFALDLKADENLKRVYYDNEHHDGYLRDISVFEQYISIEDDMSVVVRYTNGARMTYHLTAYSPWEGYRIAFNGTKGRLEYEVEERSYISGNDDDGNRPDLRDASDFEVKEPARIIVRPHWGKPLQIDVEMGEGGHGGGDVRLLSDLFSGEAINDPLQRAADHVQGAQSILTGIAANQSMATGLPVEVQNLVHFH